MYKVENLRNKIAQLVSGLFSITIRPSNIVASPVVVYQGYDKKRLYCVTVYDNLLNVVIEGAPNSYIGAFEALHKKLLAFSLIALRGEISNDKTTEHAKNINNFKGFARFR